MRLIRRFEDTVQSLFQQGEVHGTTHLYSGQEAVAVGVCSVLQPQDRVAGTYRGHGHALSLGVEPQALLDELLGRATGVCGGRAGSMNVVDLEHRLIGCFGIVGGSIAAATGAALALKRRGGVAVAFFGDGATNQGYFHECLNFAKVLALPVRLRLREQPLRRVHAVGAGDRRVDRRARSGIRSRRRTVDRRQRRVGRARRPKQAVTRARDGHGPQFIEALTYRFVGHSRSDPGKYRKPGELDAWRAARSAEWRARAADARAEGRCATIDDEIDASRADDEAGLAAPSPRRAGREFKE